MGYYKYRSNKPTMTNSNPVKDLISNKGEHQIPSVVAEFLSDESLEIVQHFGLEAPKLLNDYSNALEDALIEQVKLVQQLRAELEALKAN
jgi:hypothetical protein